MMKPRRARGVGRSPAREGALESLRAVIGVLSTSARRIERRSGVTNAQLFVLQALAEAEQPLTIGDLQQATRSGQSAVSLLVRRLERAGLVVRGTAPHDRRRRAIVLTRAGARVARRGPEPPLARVLRALDALSAGEVRQLRSGLRAFAASLGAVEDAAPLLFEAPPKP